MKVLDSTNVDVDNCGIGSDDNCCYYQGDMKCDERMYAVFGAPNTKGCCLENSYLCGKGEGDCDDDE